MTKTQQALLSLGIRLGVIAAVAVLNFISAGLTNGTLQLPIPAILVPVIGLIISEADTWLVNWQAAQQ
jgi:hypothetical protein